MTKITILLHSELVDNRGFSSAIGIRNLEIAKALRTNGHEVRLCVPRGSADLGMIDDLQVDIWTRSDLDRIARESEVCVIPQTLSPLFYSHARHHPPTIVDMVVPLQLEALSLFDHQGRFDRHDFAHGLYSTAIALANADFIICGSNSQRHYYLGQLTLLGRLNSDTYRRELITVVRQSCPSTHPIHTTSIFRDTLLSKDDIVLLWAGGIYPWYDIDVLMKSMKAAIRDIPDIKLIVAGAYNPRFEASLNGYRHAKRLAKEYGMLDKNIHFTDWVPLNQRASLYLESDMAVCTYHPLLETEFSSRSRIPEFIWAGLPVISTEGDEISSIMSAAGAGITVEAANDKQLAEAIVRIAGDKEERKKMKDRCLLLASGELSWMHSIAQLNSFCNDPSYAPDQRKATPPCTKRVQVVKPHFPVLAETNLKYRQLLRLAKNLISSRKLRRRRDVED